MPPAKQLTPVYSPVDFHLFTGLQVPDPITFTLSPQWLDRPMLYPRQATLLKVIFLREDLFTEYDYMVIEEWETNFRRTGNNGIVPDILKRMRIMRAKGYFYFREVLLVLGRRAGKGYISAIAMAYVLWRYLAKGDPQGFYGIDRDKQLACFIYAGKKEQAKVNLYRDLENVILGAPCFGPYVNRPLGESLSVFAPHDFVRMKKLRQRGVNTERDMATFLIQPKEATLMSGRGPASFMQGYDEMAHLVTAGGASRSAEEIYCLDPETRTLCADLTWRKIKDLQPGDELIGLDEHAEPGKQRKLRAATVKAKWATRSRAVRLTFDDGTTVTCSPNHRWFRVEVNAKGEINNGKWSFAGQVTRVGSAGRPNCLKVGDHIRYITGPWEIDDTRDGGYLAGIFDGEGWVSSPKTSAFKVGFSQNPGVVQDETLRLLKDAGFEPYTWRMWEGRTSECQAFEIRGIEDTLRLLGQYRPLRLLEKSRGLWEGKTPRGYRKYKTIVAIDEMPEQDLVDIETSTGTFIAEGLVSHNSAATPALDQFKKDAFIIEPSSPWQMIGQFYANWEHSLQVDEHGEPEYPEILMLQLASWEIYYDWQTAHLLPVFPEDFEGDNTEYAAAEHPRLGKLKDAPQEYDEGMQKLEKANPDTFKVERLSHWQATVDAYLDPKKIDAMFDRDLSMNHEAKSLTMFYKGHADPSKVNDNFAVAVAHAEEGEDGLLRCVFDYIHHWKPSEFPDNTIDYLEITDRLFDLIWSFKTDEFTFDQHNSATPIQALNKRVRELRPPKRMQIFERTATAPHNWARAECFKVSINQGWVTSPYYETADLELRFLQLKATGSTNKVVHQETGPVVHDDVATAMMECVWTILGEQARTWTHGALSETPLTPGLQGGFNPYSRETRDEDMQVFSRMSGFGAGRSALVRGGGKNPARNPTAFRSRR